MKDDVRWCKCRSCIFHVYSMFFIMNPSFWFVKAVRSSLPRALQSVASLASLSTASASCIMPENMPWKRREHRKQSLRFKEEMNQRMKGEMNQRCSKSANFEVLMRLFGVRRLFELKAFNNRSFGEARGGLKEEVCGSKAVTKAWRKHGRVWARPRARTSRGNRKLRCFSLV